ncbi:hypothetical protein, partial [Desulfatitalea alkaliphila]
GGKLGTYVRNSAFAIVLHFDTNCRKVGDGKVVHEVGGVPHKFSLGSIFGFSPLVFRCKISDWLTIIA